MKRIINRILKHSKATLAGVTAAIVVLSTAVAFAGYGPNRPVYDWNNPADQKGSLNGPVFNSFINTPTYGDERAFVDGRDNATPERGNFKDQLPVDPGKEYVIRMYVHNDANQTTNASGLGVAKDTKVRFKLLDGIANGHGITGYISASNDVDKNGNPVNGEIYDTVDLRNENTAFAVEYVPGSAMIQNGSHPQGVQLSDDIVKGGVLIGDKVMDGNFPGCFEFLAYVTIHVKVKAPNLTISKKVRMADNNPANDTQWFESVDAKPGDTVQWLVEVKNTGDTVQHNVIANDLLPPHLEYVNGTAKWYSASQNGVAYDFDQFEISDGDGGYNFGNYAANGGSFLVRFDTKVKDDFKDCSIAVRNLAHTRSDENKTEQRDHADVKITRTNCQPTTPPTLPNTGPGDVLGIFTVTTLAGAFVHRLFYRRFATRG
jgi:uncharacterized repeat protein (TIGR01451 family)